MLSYENLLVEKLTYQSQIMSSIDNWQLCFKYIEEALKAKKEGCSNFQIIQFEDSINKILTEKLMNLNFTKNLENKEKSNKNSLLVYVLDELKNSCINDIIEFSEKIIKLIESSLIKKKDILDFHKAYYDKIRADMYLVQEIITKEIKKSQVNNYNKDYRNLTIALYKNCFDEFYKENGFSKQGCQLCFRIGITYFWAINYFKQDIEKNYLILEKISNNNLGHNISDIEEYKSIFNNKNVLNFLYW